MMKPQAISGERWRTDTIMEIILLRTALSRIVILLLVNVMIIPMVFISTGHSSARQSGRMGADAVAGQTLWQERNCISCHALYGLGGHLGPDITNAVTRVGEDGARAVLLGGAGRMPPQPLTPEEADRLVAYLRYVDSTGVYPTRSFPAYSFGRFEKD